MPNARLLGLALGLTLALPMAGCGAPPTSPQTAAVPEEAQDGSYHGQQRPPNPNLLARQRIREELERSYPDYSPTVLSLSVRPIVRGERYAFRARVQVIGFAGPSLPLLYWVEGTYDRRQDRVVETRRTSIPRSNRR